MPEEIKGLKFHSKAVVERLWEAIESVAGIVEDLRNPDSLFIVAIQKDRSCEQIGKGDVLRIIDYGRLEMYCAKCGTSFFDSLRDQAHALGLSEEQ
jgi:hypothetical protein